MLKDSRKEMSVFLDRQTVRRRRDWRRRLGQAERILLSVAIVLVGLASLYGIYEMVFLGQTFAVKKIVVEGKWRYLTADMIAELSGVREGDNLFWVRVDRVHEQLKSDPWVETSAVQRRLPNTLWIYVEEHHPRALILKTDGLFYVDDGGNIFKRVESNDDKNYPVLSGITASDESANDPSNDSRVLKMCNLIDAFRASKLGVLRDISEVHYDKVHGYSIFTKLEPVQILFGHSSFDERIGQLDKMLDAVLARPGRIQYMLANEPGRIIVKYQTS